MYIAASLALAVLKLAMFPALSWLWVASPILFQGALMAFVNLALLAITLISVRNRKIP